MLNAGFLFYSGSLWGAAFSFSTFVPSPLCIFSVPTPVRVDSRILLSCIFCRGHRPRFVLLTCTWSFPTTPPLSGATRTAPLILYFPCPDPAISGFHEEPWLLVVRRQDLSAWCAHRSRDATGLLSQLTRAGKWTHVNLVERHIRRHVLSVSIPLSLWILETESTAVCLSPVPRDRAQLSLFRGPAL